jgi:hypothetical protein
MLAALLGLALLGAAPEDHANSINAVIGDLSFVRAVGRAPTAADDPAWRVRLHLAYVERLLRARDPRLPPEPRRRRVRLLDHLQRYWQAGVFPRNGPDDGQRPTFIDGRGARCAVAALIEQTEGSALIDALDRRYHHAYLAEIDDPALAAWADASGLTRDELALIQPAYPAERPETLLDRMEIKLGADYRRAVIRDAAPDLAQLGAARAELRWFGPEVLSFGNVMLDVDGALGWGGPSRLGWAAHASAGFLRRFWPRFLAAGVLAGLGADAVGDRIPPALVVPVDGLCLLPAWDGARVSLRAGPRFRVAGDRQLLGWSAATRLVLRGSRGDARTLGRDLEVELGAERIDRTTFVGLALIINWHGSRHYPFYPLYW